MDSYLLKRGAYKNLTLRISGSGTLRVSAPWFVPRPLVDRFVADKADWIAERRRTLALNPEVLGVPAVLSVWGVPCTVRVESPGRIPRVIHDAGHREVVVRVPPSWDSVRQRRVLDQWEKERVAQALTLLIPEWSARMGLVVDRWTVKRLRSRWGSCQPTTRSLVFNAQLGSLPPECLVHVVVHELVHLIERSHNARFHALVERWLPGSQTVRAILRKGIGSAGSDAFPDPPARPEEETGL